MYFDIAILVVLYDKQLIESKTLNSLSSEMSKSNEKVTLLIWNNGPSKIELDKNINCNVTLINDENNSGLSVVYNKFVNNVKSNKYVILDDDSHIDSGFIFNINRIGPDSIGIPLVNTEKGFVYPVINNKVNKNLKEGDILKFEPSRFVKSIGSGLVIPINIVEKMKCQYGHVFDERFFLYGVDTSFFLNLNKISFDSYHLYCSIEHSLSKESSLSNFRKKEFSYSFALIHRYYFKFPYSLLKIISIPIIKLLTNRYQSLNIKDVFVGYLSGKHYRD